MKRSPPIRVLETDNTAAERISDRLFAFLNGQDPEIGIRGKKKENRFGRLRGPAGDVAQHQVILMGPPEGGH